MNSLHFWLLIGCSYLLGAIPFGLLIAKYFCKVDIRKSGSGNPGATNVWRVCGKKAGLVTLALDILKGVIPVVVAFRMRNSLFFPYQFDLAALAPAKGDINVLAIYCGVAAIVGHNWSIFLKGKGGKGVATSAGVFLALIPLQMSIALTVFVVLLLITRHVSVGSMAASITLFSTTFIFKTAPVIQFLIFAAAGMILVKHIPNMKRLAQGTEPKVKF